MRPTLPLPPNPPTLEYLKRHGQTSYEPAMGLSTPCWLWNGATQGQGYATINWNGTTYRVHRLAYMLVKGPIPEGLVPDHLCRRRHCFNPEHLQPVTQKENVHRSPVAIGQINGSKTHCAKGHPYDEANTIIVDPRGWRACRICRREKAKKSNAVEKAKRAARRSA